MDLVVSATIWSKDLNRSDRRVRPAPQNQRQSANDAEIRRIERELLEKEYFKFTLLRRDPALAIGHLLKATGDLWRDLGSSRDCDQHGHRTLLESTLLGVGHCVRWINRFESQGLELPPASWRTLDQEAFDFLDWGTNYAHLTADHVAWSRGLLEASIDSTNKIITFSTPSDIDAKLLFEQKTDLQAELIESFGTQPTQELQRDFGRWWQEIRVIEGGFDCDETLARNLPSYHAVVEWLKASVLPGVDEDDDLGGYSLIEFLRFFAALFMNSIFWCWLEDSLDRTLDEENNFGSSILTLDQKSMLRWLERMSGLRPSSVGSIVDTLTFDISRLGSALASQPIVPSPNRCLFVLPRMIALADPNRLLAGAMNKGRGKLAYSKLIEGLSSRALAELASAFRTHGLEILLEKRVPAEGGYLTPDLVVVDKIRKQVLVIDYKHSLAPFGPSEVIDRLTEIEKGLAQVRLYLVAVKALVETATDFELLRGAEVRGVLVFGSPMVLPMRVDPDVVVANRFALYKQLTSTAFVDLATLVSWARKRPDLPPLPGTAREDRQEICVSDWRYVRTVYVAD